MVNTIKTILFSILKRKKLDSKLSKHLLKGIHSLLAYLREHNFKKTISLPAEKIEFSTDTLFSMEK
jgi:hypothetical protein